MQEKAKTMETKKFNSTISVVCVFNISPQLKKGFIEKKTIAKEMDNTDTAKYAVETYSLPSLKSLLAKASDKRFLKPLPNPISRRVIHETIEVRVSQIA